MGHIPRRSTQSPRLQYFGGLLGVDQPLFEQVYRMGSMAAIGQERKFSTLQPNDRCSAKAAIQRKTAYLKTTQTEPKEIVISDA